ncbi:Rne/Rng family ribonuclease [Aristophania vespae]|uniref:Ribonuclease G n=1 Tax=Aristophania vespae TaxID=2697033 RepID=A0A6P1NCM6_9PROT|nr:ribonuclease E/G [Aristophania vespae]QHI95278.1 Rne/Rng family ribonuclease [Aristophania vespae]
MTKHMLIDATHAEETRVVVMNGRRIDDYDVETSARRQLKGNIYLAKVIRVEPSLQAAFVDYGGNRHGFLAFSEIHPDFFQIPVADREKLLALQDEETRYDRRSHSSYDESEKKSYLEPDDFADDHNLESPDSDDGDDQDYSPEMVSGEHDTGDEHLAARRTDRFLKNYRIQEVIRRRQILLVQVVKEERGNKGAALTTYISLAGRYCVLMPNALRGGGVSRKITSETDRKRLKDIVSQLGLPRSMAMIIRTAGAGRPEQEIIRDCDYLLQLWDDIRNHVLASMAPVLVYEEASLIKRAIRDLFSRDIEDIYIDGETAWKSAREFARLLMPHSARKIKLWQNRGQTLFSYYNVEAALDAMYSPTVRLESGGYLVINQTEALVSIDVNSGKSTSQRDIEETAIRTNLEAAEEIARQLRLRDLAGLIVIDFIDMESRRHNIQVERRLKENLKQDRARIQIGRISHFGLLEMSRQRLHPSLAETMLTPCPHCHGTGSVRGTENIALHVLRSIEDEASRRLSNEICVFTLPDIALFILNAKRTKLAEIEAQHYVSIFFRTDENLGEENVRIEHSGRRYENRPQPPALPAASEKVRTIAIVEGEAPAVIEAGSDAQPQEEPAQDQTRRRRRRGTRRHNQHREVNEQTVLPSEEQAPIEEEPVRNAKNIPTETEGLAPGRRRTRTHRLNNPPRRGTKEAATEQGREQDLSRQKRYEKKNEPVLPIYQGPTPADPFGGFDIFEVINRHDDLALEAAKSSSKSTDPASESVKEEKAPQSEEKAPRRRRTRSTRAKKVETTEVSAIDTEIAVEIQPAAEKETAQPIQGYWRSNKRKATQSTEIAETANEVDVAVEEPAPSEEKKKSSTTRKRRTTTRRKKAEPKDETANGDSPAGENSAAPQPINVDDAKISKRRVGWWKR